MTKKLSAQQKGSLLAFVAVILITPDSLFIRLSHIDTWGLLFYRGAIPFVAVLLGLLIGVFWAPLLSQIGILSFVDTIGSFFGPIFGIAITDYYLIKKGKLVNKDIFYMI